jgi:hypothetical protein
MYGKSACTVPLRDRGTTEGMAEILWHRRETRRQTEKTNFSLEPREAPVYSTIGDGEGGGKREEGRKRQFRDLGIWELRDLRIEEFGDEFPLGTDGFLRNLDDWDDSLREWDAEGKKD